MKEDFFRDMFELRLKDEEVCQLKREENEHARKKG